MSSSKDGEKLRVLVKMICSSFLDATEAIEKDVFYKLNHVYGEEEVAAV